MRQDKILQHRRHKRIRASLQKAANPPLKSSAQSEFCAEHFVLGENEKENAYGNAQSGERASIAIVRRGSGRRRFHRSSPQAEVPAAAAVLRGQAYTSDVARSKGRNEARKLRGAN